MNASASMLLVAGHGQLQPDERVWGTGGWLPPEQREALDWLTLARLSGWSVSVSRPEAEALADVKPSAYRWVVLACDPEGIDRAVAELLSGWLQATPLTVVATGAPRGRPITYLAGAHHEGERLEVGDVRLVGARDGEQTLPGGFAAWRLALECDARPWATAADGCIVAKRTLGVGCVFTLGYHPSEARDRAGAATRLLRQLLVENCAEPVASLDYAGTFILRMDDPGAAQNVHCDSWSYPELGPARWQDIGTILRDREACLSVGYCTGWVDDGEAARGLLTIDGAAVPRVPGRVHESPLVVYRHTSGVLAGTVHDFAGEFEYLKKLCRAGTVSIELHGHTHMHPDPLKWARAGDRYTATTWYRELGRQALPVLNSLPPPAHPVPRGARLIERYFGSRPAALIPPGDEWTDEALALAIDERVPLVSSYYLALAHEDHFAWAQHVCAPYLDQPAPGWFEAQLPVIGYFHDREPSVYGTTWFRDWLDQWIAAGATRFITFADLAFQLSLRIHVLQESAALLVTLDSARDVPPRCRLALRLHLPIESCAADVRALFRNRPCRVRVTSRTRSALLLHVDLHKEA